MTEDEIRAQREKCFECGGQLQEIKLIDKADHGAHTNVVYVAPDAKLNKWTGTYPVEGRVLSFLCSRCGRIALHGAAVTSGQNAGKDDKADR
jgi:hypothetical protein